MQHRKLSCVLYLASALLIMPALLSVAAEEKKTASNKATVTVKVPDGEAAAGATAEQILAALPDVVATYDGGEVKSDMVKKLVLAQKESLPESGEQLQQVLTSHVFECTNMLLDQALLQQEAAKRKIAPDTKMVEEQLKELKANHSEETFKDLLTGNGLASEQELTEKLQEIFMINEMLKRESTVTEEEVKAFYDGNAQHFQTLSASHILIRSEQNDDAKKVALEKITAIQKELKDGGDFAALARKHSDCPSKEQGGSLGRFPKGSMVPEFEQALLKLKKDEISPPVETQFGYHLVLNGGEETVSLEEAAPRINDHLAQGKMQQTYQELTTKLREDKHAKILVAQPAPQPRPFFPQQ